MRWPVFFVFAAVCIVLEVSVRNSLALRSLGNIAPSFAAVLVVYVALFASRRSALWAAWIMGLLVDLMTDLPHGSHGVFQAGPLIGPHALGYTFGAFILLQIRPMLFRTSAITIALMTVVSMVAAGVVVVFVYVVHGWYPGEQLHWSQLGPVGEMVRRLGVAVYSGLVALVLARGLVWTMPIWAFRASARRHAVWAITSR